MIIVNALNVREKIGEMKLSKKSEKTLLEMLNKTNRALNFSAIIYKDDKNNLILRPIEITDNKRIKIGE